MRCDRFFQHPMGCNDAPSGLLGSLKGFCETELENPDSKSSARKFSSVIDEKHNFGALDSEQAWSSLTRDINYEYHEIELENFETFVGIVTQGRKGENQYVTRYRVEVGNETLREVESKKSFFFFGNFDSDTKVTNYFDKPITAKRVRIYTPATFLYVWEFYVAEIEFLQNNISFIQN